MVLKIILRELKSSPRFILFFIINLAIGLMGLSSIEFLKKGLMEQIAGQAKSILGADVSVSSRLKITDEKLLEVSKVFKIIDKSKSISLFSMGVYDGQSKLINIKAIENNFPFYGEITTLDGGKVQNIKADEIYLYKELMIQMDLKVGALIKIGEALFLIKDFVDKDPSQNLQFGALAPRGYISLEGLERSNLLQKGSTAFYTHLYKVDHRQDELSKLKEELTKKIDDNAVRVNIPATTSDQVSRVMSYLNDFLGLVSLSGLFLSSFGLMYLFKSFLHSRRREFAIFKFLGLKKSKIFLIYFGELLILGMAGSLLGSLLGMTIYPLIANLFVGLTGQSFNISISPQIFLMINLIGITSTIVLAPILLIPYLNIDYKVLFSFSDDISRSAKEYLLFIPLIVFYWFVSVYLSNSFMIGSLFVGLFAVLCAIAFPLGNFLLKKINISKYSLKLTTKLALTYITRHRISSLFIFSTIFLSTFLMILIPTIKTSLNKELETPTSKNGPALFLFDIQEEQLEELKSLVSKFKLDILSEAPMIRARLISINDKILKTDATENLTREEEREVRSRNRGVNLTYRATLDSAETLVSGRLPKVYSEDDEVAEISLEMRYADRIGAKIGDTLLFDVLDMPIKAKVVGLRQVRWTSFLPNFFINFSPGLLENAPKTFLVAVSNPVNSNLDEFQKEVSMNLSNISIVDVIRVVEKLSTTINNMGRILLVMAVMTFIVGLLVIFSLISHQANMRGIDISLYKLLGLNAAKIKKTLNFEIVIISLFGIGLGLVISVGMSLVLAYIVFKSSFAVNILELTFISLSIFFAIYFINLRAVSKIIGRKINDVFSEIN